MIEQFSVTSFDEVTSTNDLVKKALAAGEPEGLVVRACKQTAGYGRQGRVWKSPVGGTYQSLLLRPQVRAEQLPTLSLLAAVAVRRTFLRFADESCRSDVLIKWPNDVVFSRKKQPACDGSGSNRMPYSKLSGISLEAYASGICLGVGMNVFLPDANLEVGGKNNPAYLVGLPGSLESLVQHAGVDEASIELRADGATLSDVQKRVLEAVGDVFVGEFLPLYRAWCQAGADSFLGEFDEASYLTGRFVRMEDPFSGRCLMEGTACGVDRQGNLLIEDAQGCIHSAASGEAHII